MVINFHASSCKVRAVFVRFESKLNIFDRFFQKCLNIKFHESPSSGSLVAQCGWTDTNGHEEANSRFSQFCEKPQKSLNIPVL
jgi:hypothetical protein